VKKIRRYKSKQDKSRVNELKEGLRGKKEED